MGIERDIILDLPGLLKQAEEAFQPADVYIIRGNPDVDTEHAAEYDAFYDAIKKDVEARGLTAEFDPGLAYTSPPGGKYWIGHSRGVSRLDYAPENVQTLALDDYEPAEARQLQAEQYQKLFKELGHTDVASIPVDQRPQPGPEHYTFNDDMRTALDNMFLSKQAEYRLEDQTFTDSDGSYNVAALYELAKAKGKSQNLKIEDLLHNLEPSPEEEGEELPGHPDFVTRAEAAGTLPGVVVDYPDGRWVADGVHRLWKARQDKKKEYPAYVLNKSDLAQIKQAAGLFKRRKQRQPYLQGAPVNPSGNNTLRMLTANTPVEPYAQHYESPAEYLNELPGALVTRPKEGPLWKGNLGSTIKSVLTRPLARREEANRHARSFRMIQAAIAKREGVDARNQAWSAAMQSQPTTSVDSPWGKQTAGPAGIPHFNAGYNPQGGPGASWDQGMGGVFYDVMRRNPHEFELHSSTGNESTWLHKPTGMQYSVPDAPSSSNRFAVHAEQPNMDEWANAMRWRQGKPARNA